MSALGIKLFGGSTGGAQARLIVAASIVFALYFLGWAAISFMDENLLAGAPRHELRVGLRTKDVSVLRMAEPGAKTALDREDLAVMAAIEGVVRVFPISYADQPSRIAVDLLGQGFDSEMVLQAFEPEWVAGEIPGEDLVWQEGRALPVVINTHLLAIYNNAYARSRGLPELSAKALEAPLIALSYGAEPEAPGDPEPLSVTAKVIGLSPRVALGMAVPREALEKLHAELGIPAPEPLEAVLQLRANADVDVVRAQVDALGYAVLEADPLGRLLRQVEVVTRTALMLLIGCLLLFTLALLDQALANLLLSKREQCRDLIAAGTPGRALWSRMAATLLVWQALGLVLAAALGFGLTVWVDSAWLSPMLLELTGTRLTPTLPLTGTLIIAAAFLLTAQLSLALRLLAFTRATASGPPETD